MIKNNKRFSFDSEVGFIDLEKCGRDTISNNEIVDLLNVFKMTEKRFKYYEDGNGEFPLPYIKSNDDKNIISLSECCNLLNELHEEKEQLKKNCKNYNWYKQYKELLNENEQLKLENGEMEDYLARLEEQLSEQGTQLDFLKDENKHMKSVLDENKELKELCSKLRHKHSNLHDLCCDLECETSSLKKDVESLEKENKALKIENELLSDELEQCKAVINKKWGEYLKKKELSE